MTTKPLSKQAKSLMDEAETLDDTVGVKYGMNSPASFAAAQCVCYQFLLYCELEKAEMEAVESK